MDNNFDNFRRRTKMKRAFHGNRYVPRYFRVFTKNAAIKNFVVRSSVLNLSEVRGGEQIIREISFQFTFRDGINVVVFCNSLLLFRVYG